MKWRTALRSSGAIWVLPLLFLLGVYVGASGNSPDNYPTNHFAVASRQIILVAPILGAVVALLAGLQRCFLQTARPTRAWARVMMTRWRWLFVGAPIVSALALILATSRLPTSGADFEIFAVVAAAVVSSGFLGLAAAYCLPAPIAVPGVALGLFAWFAFPGSGTDVLLRNVNSSFVGCCSNDQVPAHSMVIGSLVLSGVLSTGSLVVAHLGQRGRVRRPMVSLSLCCVMLLAFVCSGAAARSTPGALNLLAVDRRDAGIQVCSDTDGLTLCVWPENRNRLGDLAAAVRHVDGALRADGLEPLTYWHQSAPTSRYARYSVVPQSTGDDLTWSVAEAVVERSAHCGGSSVHQAAVGALTLQAGAPSAFVRTHLDPAIAAEAARGASSGGQAFASLMTRYLCWG